MRIIFNGFTYIFSRNFPEKISRESEALEKRSTLFWITPKNRGRLEKPVSHVKSGFSENN